MGGATARRIPTEPEEVSSSRLRRARAARRLFFVGITGLLVVAGVGLLGPRTGEVEASGGGYELTLRYPEIARPGLAAVWAVEISRPGGFPRAVVVRASAAYFDIFDENGFEPDPIGSVTDGESVTWTFEPPPGDTMTISLDARVEPGVQFARKKGSLAVLENGREVVSVTFSTRVLP